MHDAGVNLKLGKGPKGARRSRALAKRGVEVLGELVDWLKSCGGEGVAVMLGVSVHALHTALGRASTTYCL